MTSAVAIIVIFYIIINIFFILVIDVLFNATFSTT